MTARNQFGDEQASPPQTGRGRRRRAPAGQHGTAGDRRRRPQRPAARRERRLVDEQPENYDYQWQRCDTAGNNCGGFGANSSSQRLVAPPRSATRISVTVSATEPVRDEQGDLGPDRRRRRRRPGVDRRRRRCRCRNQLVITGVQFVPRRLTLAAGVRRPLPRVATPAGTSSRGALVYAIGIPYGWVRHAPEVVTGSNGWATIQFFPTRLMPMHKPRRARLLRARPQAGRAPALRRLHPPAGPGRIRLGARARLPLPAGVAQLVEHQLPKLRVAGSSPVPRSRKSPETGLFCQCVLQASTTP